MTDTEMFLIDYAHAARSIGRLMLDLSAARHAYEQSADAVPVSGGYVRFGGKQRSMASPTERAAVLMADQFRAEMEGIERRLNRERRTLAHIEAAVDAAGLTEPEAAYIRLRYFEGRSAAATSQRLYRSDATCGRLRVSALGKIEKLRQQRSGPRALADEGA